MKDLREYRETAEKLRGGTVPAEFLLEVIGAAEAQIRAAQGEYTISRAVEISRRSRGYFKRRLSTLACQGLARQLSDGTWLVQDAAVPRPTAIPRGGFDPSLDPDEIARRILKPA